ncbi:MAG: hypothetical protein A3C35_05825 [Omnitrophica bacterium RIFCSPHIGHO2_02_FULL_46_11]|nr:MAG: hypothetical protein A3C35_05825 [Omnitrophica bacterium RIFCSPHIGHO2_02_FULL_46_11]
MFAGFYNFNRLILLTNIYLYMKINTNRGLGYGDSWIEKDEFCVWKEVYDERLPSLQKTVFFLHLHLRPPSRTDSFYSVGPFYF